MLLIGHRGAAGLAPENSIEAIRLGLALQCDCIEIDVQQTADGRTIVMHDKSINRTTNGKGLIRQLPYTAFDTIYLKNTTGRVAQQQRVPLFKEVLQQIKPTHARLIVELKNPALYPNLVKDVVQDIRDMEMEQKAMLFSFSQQAITTVKALAPEITTGLFIFGFENIRQVKTDFICPFFGGALLFPNLIRNIHTTGAKAFAWTVNSAWAMKRLQQKNVDGIITNRPDVFNKVFR